MARYCATEGCEETMEEIEGEDCAKHAKPCANCHGTGEVALDIMTNTDCPDCTRCGKCDEVHSTNECDPTHKIT